MVSLTIFHGYHMGTNNLLESFVIRVKLMETLRVNNFERFDIHISCIL